MKVFATPHLPHTVHRLLWLVLLLSGWLMLDGLPQALRAETVPGALAPFGQASFAQQYQEAKDFFLRLERDSAVGRERGNWLQGARNFRKIHLAQKRDQLGPASLYMLGKLYRQMFERFQVPIDLDNAIAAFTDLAALYPSNSLTDDALFAAAESLQDRAGKEDEAKALLRTIIEVYPKGDQYPKALARLQGPLPSTPAARTVAVARELPAASAPTPPLSTGTVAAPPPTGLAVIAPVKYWSSADYTRIVIEASAPVRFAPTLLEKNGDQPRRLFIDFSQSSITPQFRNPIPIGDGLLKQARSGQFSSDTVRVVLDIDSLSDYKVFSLQDPFRVVIDVHGTRQAPVRVAQQDSDGNVPAAPAAAAKTVVAQPMKAHRQTPVVLSDQKKRPIALTTVPLRKPSGKGELTLAQQLGLGVRKSLSTLGTAAKIPGRWPLA